MERVDEGLPGLSKQQRKTIMDAAAVAAYHAQKDYPVVQALVCDDAAQFNWLGKKKMLCWVHEGRHYKKLTPVNALHRELLDDFMKQFWEYYHLLLAYRQQPTVEERLGLETEFDKLFSRHSGFDALDHRIAKTNAKKDLFFTGHFELFHCSTSAGFSFFCNPLCLSSYFPFIKYVQPADSMVSIIISSK